MFPGKNSAKIEGYRRTKSMGRMGIRRSSLLSAITEMGSDFEGSDLRRFLRLTTGIKNFSLSTAWSRPRSRTHMMGAASLGEVRFGVCERGWLSREDLLMRFGRIDLMAKADVGVCVCAAEEDAVFEEEAEI